MYLVDHKDLQWKRVHIWSDGGSHLRSFIGQYMEQHALQAVGIHDAVHTWFAPHHGKGAADAHAGVLKQQQRRTILAQGNCPTMHNTTTCTCIMHTCSTLIIILGYGIKSVHDAAALAGTLKHTEVHVLQNQPELHVPPEGVPVLDGIRSMFEIKYTSDGSMMCSSHSGGAGVCRNFVFKSPHLMSVEWRVCPVDIVSPPLAAPTSALTTTPAVLPLRIECVMKARERKGKRKNQLPVTKGTGFLVYLLKIALFHFLRKSNLIRVGVRNRPKKQSKRA